MSESQQHKEPRAKSERDPAPRSDVHWQTRIDQVLDDWSDDNWLQFSMWHLHQIRAYLHRVLDDRE